VRAAGVQVGVAVVAELERVPAAARHTVLLLGRPQLGRLPPELEHLGAIQLGPSAHAAAAVLLRPARLGACLPPPQVGAVEGRHEQVVGSPQPVLAGVADHRREPEKREKYDWDNIRISTKIFYSTLSQWS
jgi:hypothetical protein